MKQRPFALTACGHLLTTCVVVATHFSLSCLSHGKDQAPASGNSPRSEGRGLHGYISDETTQPPSGSEYGAGFGFYSAVWPLVDQPVANFQIGLPGCWILPDNRLGVAQLSNRLLIPPDVLLKESATDMGQAQ